MSSTFAHTLQLGRIPLRTLGSVSSIRFDGENISLGGIIEPVELSTGAERIAAVAARREQILGLNNTIDQPVIPIVSLDDPSLTGYYANPRATVDIDAGGLELGQASWSFSGTRVPGRDVPRMELLTLGGLRSNSHSITASAADPWVGLPGSAVDAWDGEATSPPHDFDGTRNCTDGTTAGIYVYSTTGITLRVAQFSVAPADYFDAAATLTVDGRAVTGRQLHNTDASAVNWSISNGIVTVAKAASGGRFTLKGAYQSGSATTDHDLELLYTVSATPYTLDTWTTITVLRNTPEVVVVRLGLRSGSRMENNVLDVTCRRGARTMELTHRTDTSTEKKIQHQVASAGTAGTNIVRGTSGTRRWYMTSPQSYTFDATQGGLTVTSSRANYGIGVYDSTAGSPDDLAGVRDQYFGVVEPWQTVVGR